MMADCHYRQAEACAELHLSQSHSVQRGTGSERDLRKAQPIAARPQIIVIMLDQTLRVADSDDLVARTFQQ